MDMQAIRLKIFYPDQIRDEELASYNQTFDLWYKIWIETRKEVDAALGTPSDNFARQSEILALFVGDQPIGMICHRYVDIRQTCVIKDSFFSSTIWPEEVKQKLPALGATFVLGSHVFIDPAYRKSASGLPTKNILCALSFAHLNGTRPDVVLGMMRKDKSMHDIFYKSGAIMLHGDTNWYQIPVDLVAFQPKKKMILIDPAFMPIVETIGFTCSRFGANYYSKNLNKEQIDADFRNAKENKRAG